ncbi:hypothetical protein DERF_009099 [Dermatophagoides farinae]|uniref:C2H2-type domain-containing protein n=1 Tax=Dermatophagoides farinae TaxID=6954 RepID=A0A922L139_DERFA|nr:hypothetical protein DERF_009099 [Dermatophagoides farinae]
MPISVCNVTNGPSQRLVHAPCSDASNGTSNVTNGPFQDQIFSSHQVPIVSRQHVPISVCNVKNGPSLNNDASIGKIPLHFCERCNQSFNSKWNLKRHNKRIHDYAGYLAVHLKSAHGVEIQVKILKFKDFEMFKSFLEKTKEETCSNYLTRRIERDSNQQVITANYICSRRGTIPANRSERKRAAKSNKTIKIGNICPSQISLTRIKDGIYTAKWTTTHVGHELDMKFGRLPNKYPSTTSSLSTKLTKEIVKNEKIHQSRNEYQNHILPKHRHQQIQPLHSTMITLPLSSTLVIIDC